VLLGEGVEGAVGQQDRVVRTARFVAELGERVTGPCEPSLGTRTGSDAQPRLLSDRGALLGGCLVERLDDIAAASFVSDLQR
jgi:hypothetical protein